MSGTSVRPSARYSRVVEFNVRQATAADTPGMADVYRRAWTGAYEPFLEPGVLTELAEDRARTFEWGRGIEREDAEVLVAVDSAGAVLGVVQADEVLDEPERDLPEITMLYVDPTSWGTGVGSALLAAAIGWIARRGHAEARLRVVENHQRARRFYEREGWTPDATMERITTDLAKLVYYRRLVA